MKLELIKVRSLKNPQVKSPIPQQEREFYEELAEDASFMDSLKARSQEDTELTLLEEQEMEGMGDRFEENRQRQLQKSPEVSFLTAKQVLETEYPGEEWIIEKVLARESITLLVGEAGTFKSYICLAIAKSLATGEPFLGKFETLAKAKVLIIDKENKLRRVSERMAGMGFPPSEDVFFLEYPFDFILEPNHAFLRVLSDVVTSFGIEVIVLDSFVDMFEGNENSSTDTALAFNALRSISPHSSFILIHHDSKPIPKFLRTAAQKTRGSSNIIAQVDSQFYLEKSLDNRAVYIEQGKSRDSEPLPKFVVNLVTEEEVIRDFQYQGEFVDSVKRVEQAKTLLYETLMVRPMLTKEELFEALATTDITRRTLQDGLNSLTKQKMVDSSKRPGMGNKHFYFLVEGGELNGDQED